MTRPNIVTLSKLAMDWHLPEAWLRRHCMAGNIPYTRISRTIYLNPQAAAEAIERLAGSAPEADEAEWDGHPTPSIPGMGEEVDTHA